MTGLQRKSPRQQEWRNLEKREARFLSAAGRDKGPVLNRKLERFVPKKLESTLNQAFFKAFELIFNKGTPIIEKTYKREDLENTYKVNAYAAKLKESKKNMKAFSREAGKNKVKNLAAAGAAGVGMGALGIGLPDIPLFTGMILKSIYETSLSYGFPYDTGAEQCYILKLITAALSRGDLAHSNSRELDDLGRRIQAGCDPVSLRTDLMRQASNALSAELLYMKFLQGIPIAGIVGGVYDAVYLKKITDYADIKYKRRFLERGLSC